MEYIDEHGNILDKVPDKISFAPRATFKNGNKALYREFLLDLTRQL